MGRGCGAPGDPLPHRNRSNRRFQLAGQLRVRKGVPSTLTDQGAGTTYGAGLHDPGIGWRAKHTDAFELCAVVHTFSGGLQDLVEEPHELEMSKSGVYAHFKSKQRLQLDTIEAARQVFFEEVMEPGLSAPEGLGQLTGLCEAFISYVERGVFPGGCFFAGLLGEFDALSGAIHTQVAADHTRWLEALATTARATQARGELDRQADVEQLVFELVAAMETANYLYVLYRDPEMLKRARTAVRNSIDRRRP